MRPRKHLAKLTPRSERIVRALEGDGHAQETLEEIGRRHAITAQRTRQIYRRACAHLAAIAIAESGRYGKRPRSWVRLAHELKYLPTKPWIVSLPEYLPLLRERWDRRQVEKMFERAGRAVAREGRSAHPGRLLRGAGGPIVTRTTGLTLIVRNPDRLCALCGKAIPPAKGNYFAHLNVLVHLDECAEEVRGMQRTYDRSTRGRWRPKAEVLRMIRERRARAAGDDPEDSRELARSVDEDTETGKDES